MFLKNLSKFIFNYQYEQSSIETIKAAKSGFLDFFGVTYKGINERSSQIAFNTVTELFSSNRGLQLKSSLIGKKNVKLNVLDGSFVNGISAHSLDLDDGHRGAHIHPGALVFPTAVGISEAYKLSGREFLESVIVGYEIGILLGKMVNPNHRNKGFHSTGTVGTFVTGAVASKLLKLNEDQITHTLGLCGTQAAGLLESDHGGSMGKSLHVGKAVYNGMLSAFLAKNGFTGSESILEGDEGFFNTMVLNNYSLKKEDFDFEDSLKNLGEIRFRDIYFKKYPFCRHLHSAIDTALKLRTSLCNEYKAIDKVTIKTYKISAEHNNYKPKNIEELKQSLPYAVAMTLVCGEITVEKLKSLIKYGLLDDYSEVEKVTNIKELANKINIIFDEELDLLYPTKRPSNIIIKLDESFRGGIFQNISFIPKGDIENPFTLKELIDKFKILNPSYDIGKLAIIDNIEQYTMNQVIEVLNG